MDLRMHLESARQVREKNQARWRAVGRWAHCTPVSGGKDAAPQSESNCPNRGRTGLRVARHVKLVGGSSRASGVAKRDRKRVDWHVSTIPHRKEASQKGSNQSVWPQGEDEGRRSWGQSRRLKAGAACRNSGHVAILAVS